MSNQSIVCSLLIGLSTSNPTVPFKRVALYGYTPGNLANRICF